MRSDDSGAIGLPITRNRPDPMVDIGASQEGGRTQVSDLQNPSRFPPLPEELTEPLAALDGKNA